MIVRLDGGDHDPHRDSKGDDEDEDVEGQRVLHLPGKEPQDDTGEKQGAERGHQGDVQAFVRRILPDEHRPDGYHHQHGGDRRAGDPAGIENSAGESSHEAIAEERPDDGRHQGQRFREGDGDGGSAEKHQQRAGRLPVELPGHAQKPEKHHRGQGDQAPDGGVILGPGCDRGNPEGQREPSRVGGRENPRQQRPGGPGILEGAKSDHFLQLAFGKHRADSPREEDPEEQGQQAAQEDGGHGRKADRDRRENGGAGKDQGQ